MANKELSFSLPIGPSYTGDIQDQEIAAELFKIYNSVNLIASKLDEYTNALPVSLDLRPYTNPGNSSKETSINRFYLPASVDMVAGTIVYILASNQIAKGSASLGGQLIVLSDVKQNNYAEVSPSGIVPAFAGLIPGEYYAISNNTPGAIVVAASIPVGVRKRIVGFAVSSSELYFRPEYLGVIQS